MSLFSLTRRSRHGSGTALAAATLGVVALTVAAAPGAAMAAAPAVLQSTSIWTSVPTSPTPLQSLEVIAPGTGNIIVTVTGSVNFATVAGTQGYYCLDLSQTSGDVGGCTPNAGSDSAVRNYISPSYPATVPGYGQLASYTIVKVWHVTTSQKYTFYLNGNETGFQSAYLFQPSITALFVPGTLSH